LQRFLPARSARTPVASALELEDAIAEAKLFNDLMYLQTSELTPQHGKTAQQTQSIDLHC
jgi:hypothetical protein